KLILPTKEKNTQYENIDKQNIPITTLQRFDKSSYQNDKFKSPTESEGQTLDLSKWKQENQDEWTEIRQKIEKNRKQK
ncbi:MAG: hypothetical protein KAJ69_06750, partial [Thermoplasmatales archaeon]|nr:hypothetical protein [Thermoplasmatales archaeon]